MSVILILIVASLGLALAFLAAFVWAVRAGQYEDTCTPSLRVLMENDAKLDSATQTSPRQGFANEGESKPLNRQSSTPGHAFFRTS